MRDTFSLLSEPWIPVFQSTTSPDTLLSLEDLWEKQHQIYSLSGSPFLYSAIWRLLSAIHLYDGHLNDFEWEIGRNILVSEFDCPDSSGKAPPDLLYFSDGNSVAWSPRRARIFAKHEIAQALVQIYFSDRPGLKARVKGFSVSGAAPPHIGKISILRAGKSIGETLDINLDKSWGMAGFEFFLHPWRQIKFTEAGQMVVAANHPYNGKFQDPWIKDSGRMKYIRSTPLELVEEEIPGDFIAITFVLKQAKILGCDLTTFTKKEKGNV